MTEINGVILFFLMQTKFCEHRLHVCVAPSHFVSSVHSRVEKRLSGLCFSYLILALLCGILWICEKTISYPTYGTSFIHCWSLDAEQSQSFIFLKDITHTKH